MIPNLVVSGMYSEMSTGFLNQEIKFKQEENLNSIDDIPKIVFTNIKFTQFAGAVIFSVSSIEAFINHLIYDILFDRFELNIFSSQPNFKTIEKRISKFKKKYDDDDKMEELFRQEVLTRKINKLYKCFDLQPISESPKKADQKLWKDFEKLQNIRNELIHPKPEFLESEEFLEFINMEESKFRQFLLTPTIFRLKLFDNTPLFQPNAGNNTILINYTFNYKADALFEHLLLTGTEYNITNVKTWGTRWTKKPFK